MINIDEQNYKALLDKEAKYWGEIYREVIDAGIFPDLQIPFRKQKINAIWDDSELNFFVRGKYIQKILNMSSYKPKMECLELCCGAGSLALEAARRGAHVTGIDISFEAIQIGKNYQRKIKKQPSYGKIDLVVGDLNTLKLPEERYDIVFVWDGLHHILKIDHCISEVVKTLKDDGFFVVHDHVKPPKWAHMLKWAISMLLLIILPTEKKRKKKKKKQAQNEILISPFEDISGENIIKSISTKLKIIELQRYMSFSNYVVVRIPPNFKFRFGLIRIIMLLDAFFVYFHILKPEYFFVIAKKFASARA